MADVLNFEDIERKYSFCLGAGCDKVDGAYNCSDIDKLLSPELGTAEVKLSLLEIRQAELYRICISEALRAIRDSGGGWLAPCGCWHLWNPIRPTLILQIYGG
jgi:hypothetical protein